MNLEFVYYVVTTTTDIKEARHRSIAANWAKGPSISNPGIKRTHL